GPARAVEVREADGDRARDAGQAAAAARVGREAAVDRGLGGVVVLLPLEAERRAARRGQLAVLDPHLGDEPLLARLTQTQRARRVLRVAELVRRRERRREQRGHVELARRRRGQLRARRVLPAGGRGRVGQVDDLRDLVLDEDGRAGVAVAVGAR